MIKNILFIFLLLISLSSFSQINVTGKIVDQNNLAIEFATITLQTTDGLLSKNELSDENGNFIIKIQEGQYLLEISYLGNILYEKEISVTQNIDLGIIHSNNSTLLETVVITGQKRLIEKKADRLVFNVENSISATGGTGLDALSVTPLLRVQNDQIAMIGKSNMSVMVNDRFINLSGDDLINYLRNIKSDDIKRIEVITSPPAKYDAQGNSGIINIVTKNVKRDSLYGSLNTSLSQANKSYGTTGLNLNYQKNDLTMTASANYMNGSFEPYQEYTLWYPNYLWKEESNRINHINNLTGRFTIDYRLNSKLRIGAEYSLSNNLPEINSENKSSIYSNTNVLDSLIRNQSRIEMDRLTNAFNVYSVIDLDTLGKKINFDFDYLKYDSKTENNFFNSSYFANGTEKPNSYFSANNNSNLNIDIITTRLDFEIPTNWISLNFGTKLTFIENNSDVSFYNTTSGNPILDPLQTNQFIYNENTQALYISGFKNITEKLQMQIGFRGEYTQIKGNSETLAQITEDKYFKLFPSFYANYIINNDNTLSFNYNRRINRPSYNNLNPFRFYSTSFNYTEGNPFLQPYTTDNFEFSFMHKNLYSMLYFSVMNNSFDQVTFVNDSDNIQIVRPLNFFNQYNFGLFQSASFRVKDFFESNSNISVFYSKSKSEIPETVPTVSKWSGSFNTNNTFNLDKDKRFKAELGFLYNLPSLAGSYELSSCYQLNLGFKASFMQKNLQLAINFNDVFKTNEQIFTQTVNGVKQENFDYRDIRRVRISLTYNFGKSFKMNKHNETNQEEKRRIQ